MCESRNYLKCEEVIEKATFNSAKNDTTGGYEAIIQQWDTMPADTKAALLAIVRQFQDDDSPDSTSSDPSGTDTEFAYVLAMPLVG